jgi:hypothetical protein
MLAWCTAPATGFLSNHSGVVIGLIVTTLACASVSMPEVSNLVRIGSLNLAVGYHVRRTLRPCELHMPSSEA